jgi:hypothetical protein
MVDLDDWLRRMLCGLAHPATGGRMAYLPERALPISSNLQGQ